jgi:hypothetical protein
VDKHRRECKEQADEKTCCYNQRKAGARGANWFGRGAERSSRRRRCNLADEAVAAARERFDKTWLFCRIAEGRAQLSHGEVHCVVKVAEFLLRPDPAAQFFPRYHFARIFQKAGKNFERLFLEFDPHARFA